MMPTSGTVSERLFHLAGSGVVGWEAEVLVLDSPSVFVCRIQFVEEPARCGSNTDAIQVVYLETVRCGPERTVLDEDAMDDRSNGGSPVAVDNSSHHCVEMPVLVLLPRVLCSVEHEFDNVGN
jgi:hypothetical protein